MMFEALETPSLDSFRRQLKILAAAGIFIDGFDLTVIAVALPFLIPQFHLSPALTGWVASSAVLGVLAGAVTVGYLTDLLGRRTMFIVDLACFVLFAALAAFSQTVWQLLLFRFLLGVGLGADYAISPTLMAEFSPSQSRGSHVAFMNLSWQLGALASFVIGAALAPFGHDAWRYMLLVGALLAVVVLFYRTRIPESPRWLARQGRMEDAAGVMTRLGAAGPATPAPADHARWSDLFGPLYCRSTVFVCSFWFCFVVAFYGISLYTPTVLKTFGLLGAVGADLGAALIGVAVVAGVLAGLATVDIWGRRPLLIVGFIGLVVPLAVLALLPHPTAATLILLFAIAQFFVNGGPGIMNFIYPTELFPTGIRASAMGLGTSFSRVGAVLGILLFPQLIRAWGLGPALWLFVLVGLIGIVIALALAPETRRKSLEAIATQAGAAGMP